jgi:ubiquitin carboxyl-terminal hydrolase 25/28
MTTQVAPTNIVSSEEADIDKAIMLSLNVNPTNGPSTYEPLDPEHRQRQEGVPVGLMNVGNTCYFNSLMQTYFMIPQLVKEVLQFKPDPSHLQ